MALREGKNREVKNVLGALGLQVNRLIRISYGPFQLGDMPIGSGRRGRGSACSARPARGEAGREAGVDFDSAMPRNEPESRRSAVNPNRRLRKTAEESAQARRRADGRDGRTGEPRPRSAPG